MHKFVRSINNRLKLLHNNKQKGEYAMNMKKLLTFNFVAVFVILIGVFCVCFGCSQECHGTFYSLEVSYELNYITKEDLKNIAYYHNNSIIFPQVLSAETEKAIKETACERLCGNEYGIENVSIDGIGIEEYCGVYNEYYAVVISNNYISTPTDVPYYVKEIDGVEFYYTGYGVIEIWHPQSD